MNILYGIFICLLGFLLVWKARWIYENFGAVPFAQKFLQTSGGTTFFYQLIGLFVIFVGLMFMTNAHLGVAQWIFENFFGAYEVTPEDVQKAQEAARPEF